MTQHERSENFGTGADKHKPMCLCGLLGTYSDKHEAYYCSASGVWLESKCGDEECEFCVDRPDIMKIG